MKETIEHNNRFYGEELKTESEQLKEWLVIANKHNDELQKERDMYKGSFETMSENYFKLENIIKEVITYIEWLRNEHHKTENLGYTKAVYNTNELLVILHKLRGE